MLYPVQYGSPALHSDALEDSEHGESDVVEAGDAEVWSLPVIHARRDVRVAHVGPEWRLGFVVRVTRARLFALLHDYIYNRVNVRPISLVWFDHENIFFPSFVPSFLPSFSSIFLFFFFFFSLYYYVFERKKRDDTRLLTDIPDAVTRFMQGPRIEFEADDGEYHDGEKYQQADLQKRRHCLDNRLEHHLETCLENIR